MKSKVIHWFGKLQVVRVLHAAASSSTPSGFRPYDEGFPHEQKLLLDHAAFGCTSIWCISRETIHPFVFRRRTVKGFIPCEQLIYCRDISDFIRFARPLGRFLARRGGFLVMIDANEPIKGLVGKYFGRKMQKYFMGQKQPRLGDLAYTEIAMFGV